MCDINIIATDWYLGLFSTSLPSEVVVRIWDALFNEVSYLVNREFASMPHLITASPNLGTFLFNTTLVLGIATMQ